MFRLDQLGAIRQLPTPSANRRCLRAHRLQDVARVFQYFCSDILMHTSTHNCLDLILTAVSYSYHYTLLKQYNQGRKYGHVACTWMMIRYNILIVKRDGKKNTGDLGIDGRMIILLILNEKVVTNRNRFF